MRIKLMLKSVSYDTLIGLREGIAEYELDHNPIANDAIQAM